MSFSQFQKLTGGDECCQGCEWGYAPGLPLWLGDAAFCLVPVPGCVLFASFYTKISVTVGWGPPHGASLQTWFCSKILHVTLGRAKLSPEQSPYGSRYGAELQPSSRYPGKKDSVSCYSVTWHKVAVQSPSWRGVALCVSSILHGEGWHREVHVHDYWPWSLWSCPSTKGQKCLFKKIKKKLLILELCLGESLVGQGGEPKGVEKQWRG